MPFDIWTFLELNAWFESTVEKPAWKTWKLSGTRPRSYAVYVDEADKVWVSDFGANAVLRFDPESETFTSFPSARKGAQVRQLLGRPGEVWAPESGTDTLVRYRFASQ